MAPIKHRGLSATILEQTLVTDPEESFWFEQLLKHGANPNYVFDVGTGDTIVFATVEARRDDLTALLIARGAELNRTNSVGNTPLIETLFLADSPYSALLLLKGGADWKPVNRHGKGLIDFLSQKGEESVKSRTNQGPWWQDYVATVKWLAAHGAAIPANLSALVPELAPAGPPPAVAAAPASPLRERRDAVQARLAQPAEAEDGDAPLYVALNRSLGERGRSLEFYDTLAPANPARVFLSRQLVREFVALRRYADAALGWDARQSNRLFNTWSKAPASTSGHAGAADDVRSRLLQQLLDNYEALVGSGSFPEAQNLAGQIGGADRSPETVALLQARAARAGHPELPATQNRAGVILLEAAQQIDPVPAGHGNPGLSRERGRAGARPARPLLRSPLPGAQPRTRPARFVQGAPRPAAVGGL